MKYIIFIFSLLFISSSYDLSMFYCGFSERYCGHSVSDDVYSKASYVILAFANIQPSGAVICDTDHFPAHQFQGWKNTGKKVLLSIGGQNGNWTHVFISPENRDRFINSLVNYVKRFSLDGVDLDIQSYIATPRIVAQTIVDLKSELMKVGHKLLIVSP